MMKFEIELGGGKLTFEADTLQEIIQQSVFYSQLPSHCPIDGTVAIFHYKGDDDDNHYYSLISTGVTQYEYKLGVRKDKMLFPKYSPHEVWVTYDSQRRSNVVVWLNGQTMEPPYKTISKDQKTKKVLIDGKEVQAPAGRRSLDDEDIQGNSASTPTHLPTDFANSDEAANWAVRGKYYPDFSSAKVALVSIYNTLTTNQKADKAAFWLAWTQHCTGVKHAK